MQEKDRMISVKIRAPLTTRSHSLRCICTVLQNGQDKTLKTSPKNQFIMVDSQGLPQDTKSMRS